MKNLFFSKKIVQFYEISKKSVQINSFGQK